MLGRNLDTSYHSFPLDCPVPIDIPNAYKLYDGLTNGSVTLYSCVTGFTESPDDVRIYCVEGVWTTTALFCKGYCLLII